MGMVAGGSDKKVVKRKVVKKKPVAKLPPGRPSHVVTQEKRDRVLEFSGMGLTNAQVAKLMDISQDTLERKYKEELSTAALHKNVNVARNLYNMATNPEHKSSAQSAMFWMKTRAGWRETNRLEVANPDGSNLQLGQRDTIDSRLLTVEQRDQLREILLAAMANQAPPTMETIMVEDMRDDGEEED